MRVLWSSVEEELKGDPGILAKLDNPAAITGTVLDTPVYKANKLVRSAKKRPLPLSLYLDGVQYNSQAAGRSEAVLGLWIGNCISGRRHFVCGLKAADFCRCGCRGWCSLAPVFQRLEWMVEGLQCAKVPRLNPDGSDFVPAGMPTGARLTRPCVLVWIKGDWAEHVHSLGLASWGAHWAPCQYCKMSKPEIAEKGHTMCSTCPAWSLRAATDYEMACKACEVNVSLKSDSDKKSLALSLR